MKLRNVNAIITGGNRGLGLAIAREFVKEGSSIVICARDSAKLERSAEGLRGVAGGDQQVIAIEADVSVEADVERLVGESIGKFGRIDVLVNNAGVYGPKGLIEDVSIADWIRAIEINLYGVVYTCKRIIAHMKENGGGKIINLSGGGATSPLPRISAYAASKAAVVRLTETLAEECRDFGIDINAVAPGALNTRLLDEVLEAGPEAVGEQFYEKALKQKDSGGAPLEKGAGLCVYLASHDSDGITGRLISAIWDPWVELAKYKGDLDTTDIYTLRRIIPKERNKSWGD